MATVRCVHTVTVLGYRIHGWKWICWQQLCADVPSKSLDSRNDVFLSGVFIKKHRSALNVFLQADCSASSIQDITVDLLAGVLQLVPQSHRLGSCALVNRKWRQAANVATTSVVLGHSVELVQGVSSLSAWLNSSADVSRITDIKVEPILGNHTQAPALYLPSSKLVQLRTLKLLHCQLVHNVAAAASAVASVSTARPPAGLTALSRLKLVNTLLDLSPLASCIGLQHLCLNHVKHTAAESLSAEAAAGHVGASGAAWASLLAPALPRLPQLTHLTLKLQYTQFRGSWWDGVPEISRHAACLSSLQHLQQLCLDMDTLAAVDYIRLPVSLTLLQISKAPVLSPVTGGQHLDSCS